MPWTPYSYSGSVSRVAHPIRYGSTTSSGYEGLIGAPRPRTPPPTPGTERVSKLQAYLDSLSLVHLLMVSSFLEPATAWHMMHAKADAMGMTQRVAPFLD